MRAASAGHAPAAKRAKEASAAAPASSAAAAPPARPGAGKSAASPVAPARAPASKDGAAPALASASSSSTTVPALPAASATSVISQVPTQTVFEHPSNLKIKVVNVVATANLGRALNLRTIALNARNAEFNPDRFNALVLRFDKPPSTGLVFSSGKIVVTGVRSELDAHNACKRMAAMIKKIGFDKPVASAEMQEFKVQNIVASTDLGWPIQLEHLAFEHHRFSSYEPEIFPGLIYRMSEPKLVCLIFVTGKVVLTGAKYQEDIEDAFNKIFPVLQGFKKSRYLVAGQVVDATAKSSDSHAQLGAGDA